MVYTVAYTYRNPLKQALAATEQELQERLQERQWIEGRIAELQQAIQALTPLAQSDVEEKSTLPQLCLRALARGSGGPLSIPQIRDRLFEMGIDLSGYSNPLAVLHTTLGRLQASGYVGQAGGNRFYRITAAGRLALE